MTLDLGSVASEIMFNDPPWEPNMVRNPLTKTSLAPMSASSTGLNISPPIFPFDSVFSLCGFCVCVLFC